jgi:hypothetical protein
MPGEWCGEEKEPTVYKHGNYNDCWSYNGLNIHRRGYERSPEDGCEIKKTERMTKDAYVVHALCSGQGMPPAMDHSEFRLDRGRLIVSHYSNGLLPKSMRGNWCWSETEPGYTRGKCDEYLEVTPSTFQFHTTPEQSGCDFNKVKPIHRHTFMVESHCGYEGGEYDSKDKFWIAEGKLHIQNIWNNR